MGKTKTSLLGVKNYRIELKLCTLVEDRWLYNPYSGFLKILKILDFVIIFLNKVIFLKFLGKRPDAGSQGPTQLYLRRHYSEQYNAS